MAQNMLGSVDSCFTNSLESVVTDANPNADARLLGSFADLESIATLKTALSTYDANTYTATVLNQMNVNDLLFAWRNCSTAGLFVNAKTIADYIPRQSVRP